MSTYPHVIESDIIRLQLYKVQQLRAAARSQWPEFR
eukprot:COSAG01_NODE_36318_length_519_cov_1.292857_1_plen_35_part_01